MTARDDAGFDSFRHPGRYNVVTNFSFYPDQVACLNLDLLRVTRVNPQRVSVRDFI